MAGRGFIAMSPQLADIRELVTIDAAAWLPGAALVINSDGKLEECGADPTTVAAVALDAAGRGPGFLVADSPSVITGRNYKTSVIMTEVGQQWIGRLVNGGTDPATPTQTMVGEIYGIIKDADGIWAVDLAETTADVVIITGVDIPNKLVWFRFLEAVIPGHVDAT